MMNLALIDASLRGNFHPHYDWSPRNVDEDGSEEMSDYSRPKLLASARVPITKEVCRDIST